MAVIDMLTRLNTDTQLLRTRLQTLTQQTATGFKGTELGDLGSAQPRALDLKGEILRQNRYTGAIAAAAGRATATQGVLGRLGDIASRFANTVAFKLDPTDPEGITRAATEAKGALLQVAQLLNSQQGGQYLFGGTDVTNPPIPDAGNIATAGFASQIAAGVSSLGGGNAAAVLAGAVAAAGSNAAGVTPFSAYLSDPAAGLNEPRRAVPTADGQTMAYGVPANRNALAVSQGATTTGAWARDLLGGLAAVAAMTPAQAAANPADFRQLAQGVTGWLKGAATALAEEQGALGQTQAQLASLQSAQADSVTALTQQLAAVQEVDMASTITKLQGTQTALQASYQAISQLGSLSLVQFLR